MELKQDKIEKWDTLKEVLIVPSGIETALWMRCKQKWWVLIVPSGIETKNEITAKEYAFVLIVPSGIETTKLAGHHRGWDVY